MVIMFSPSSLAALLPLLLSISDITSAQEWDESLRIKGENTFERSGYSISLSGDGNVCAVGERGYGGFAGRVRVFIRGTNTRWNRMGSDIDGEAPSDFSGHSVSLNTDGSVVAIGLYLYHCCLYYVFHISLH